MFYIIANKNAKKHLLNLVFETLPLRAGVLMIILSFQSD